MSDRIIIGIDPGVYGAVACLTPSGPFVYDMPTYKKGKRPHTCEATLAEKLVGAYRVKSYAFVESVHAGHGYGGVQSFSFGESFGIIKGVLAALEIPYELVSPQKWKKAMAVPSGDKKNSVPIALRLFPTLTGQLTSKKKGGDCSCIKNLDGRADALLIAEYGRRLVAGGR